jgi:hypothetical protein
MRAVPSPGNRAPLLMLSVLLLAGVAGAESELLLPVPKSFGVVPASTYDEKGRRVGDAHLAVERLENGRVRLIGQSGYEGAARNIVSAELELVNDGTALRLLSQSSASFDQSGKSLGKLTIDHQGREGRCAPPQESGDDVRTKELPSRERLANVPVNLLFLPLARGDKDEVKFQVFLCRGKPRIIDAKASVARRVKTEDGIRDIVEVQYDLDFGPMLSRLARPFMPKVAVWFDPKNADGWLAHRMPLFAKGPTVMVVRTGIAPELLE